MPLNIGDCINVITYVSPNEFYVTNEPEKFNLFSEQVGSYAHAMPASKLGMGMKYLVKSKKYEGNFFRGISTTVGDGPSVKIKYYDFGDEEIVTQKELFELPEEVRYETYTYCCSFPENCIDKFKSETREGLSFLFEEAQTSVDSFTITSLNMRTNGLHCVHLDSGGVNILKMLNFTYDDVPVPDKMPSLKNNTTVKVIFYVSPQEIYVTDDETSFVALQEKVSEYTTLVPAVYICQGSMYLIRSKNHGGLYRGRVRAIKRKDITVKFIDYGDTEVVDCECIFILPDGFCKNTDMAIQISVPNDWNDKALTKQYSELFQLIRDDEIPLVVHSIERNQDRTSDSIVCKISEESGNSIYDTIRKTIAKNTEDNTSSNKPQPLFANNVDSSSSEKRNVTSPVNSKGFVNQSNNHHVQRSTSSASRQMEPVYHEVDGNVSKASSSSGKVASVNGTKMEVPLKAGDLVSVIFVVGGETISLFKKSRDVDFNKMNSLIKEHLRDGTFKKFVTPPKTLDPVLVKSVRYKASYNRGTILKSEGNQHYINFIDKGYCANVTHDDDMFLIPSRDLFAFQPFGILCELRDSSVNIITENYRSDVYIVREIFGWKDERLQLSIDRVLENNQVNGSLSGPITMLKKVDDASCNDLNASSNTTSQVSPEKDFKNVLERLDKLEKENIDLKRQVMELRTKFDDLNNIVFQ